MRPVPTGVYDFGMKAYQMKRPELTSTSFQEDAESALRTYEDQGYFVEPDVFNDDQCARLIAEAEELARENENPDRPLMQPHRQRDLFVEAMRHPRIVDAIKRICGGRVSALQSEFFFCRAGTPGFAPHQDNYFVEAPLGAFASAWIALCDVSLDNGGLYLYPSSHGSMLPVTNFDTVVNALQDPNARSKSTVVPGHLKRIDPELPKGSVLFLHGCVVHGSNDNTSDDPRYALLNTYIREGATFRPGNYAGRRPVSVDA